MKQQICFSASCCCDRKNRVTHRCEARYSSGGCAARRSRGADELRHPALGGQPQFIGCYSAPTVFTASNLKEFSQILCFRMCCTDQFPAPFALCAAVCAFRGWGGVFTHQSPLKRVLRRTKKGVLFGYCLGVRRNHVTRETVAAPLPMAKV